MTAVQLFLVWKQRKGKCTMDHHTQKVWDQILSFQLFIHLPLNGSLFLSFAVKLCKTSLTVFVFFSLDFCIWNFEHS